MFSGRANRRSYFRSILFLLFCFFVASIFSPFPLLAFIIYAIGIIYCFSKTVQRLHDFNMSGWFTLVPIILLAVSVGISSTSGILDSVMFYILLLTFPVFSIVLLIPSGTYGHNKFG